MKAILLAAGLGTRLRPMTDNRPKCMVAVAGKPVLQRNIEWLRANGISELVINLHYFPDEVTGYFGDGRALGVNITYSYEAELLGTAGAVGKVRETLGDEKFLVVYADNLISCSLKSLLNLHAKNNSILSMALFWREDVTASGVVLTDREGRITAFKEKPKPGEVPSNWVNAGLLVCESAVLGYIPQDGPSDFGHDIFPALLRSPHSMSGYKMGEGETLDWIDTLVDFERTNRYYLGEKTLA